MGADLSVLDSILKNQYLGPIREQVNNDVIILSELEKDKDSVVGKNFTIPVHYAGNEGIGAIAENGTLPTAGSQQYKEVIVPQKYVYGRIEISGPTIKATKSDAGAFARAVDSEVQGMTKDLKRELNRMFWGNGTGVLSACGTTSASTTVNVASTKYIRPGMYVDIRATADGTAVTNGTNVKVLTVPSATTFTVGTAVTTSSSHAVYRANSRGNEVMGLQGIVTDSGVLQTLDPATYAFWKANVLANSGTNRAITEGLMQTAMDTTEQYSDGDVKFIIGSYGVRRAYQALLTSQRQYMNTLDLKGGKKALDYNGIPFAVDKDCPANSIYFLDTNALKIYQLSDFDWMQEDGAILSRVSGKDAYEAVLYRYLELGCSSRNAQTVLKDITEA